MTFKKVILSISLIFNTLYVLHVYTLHFEIADLKGVGHSDTFLVWLIAVINSMCLIFYFFKSKKLSKNS